MVQNVEKFRSKFEIRLFRCSKILEDREIPSPVAGRFDRIAANIAERTQGRVDEGTSIEPSRGVPDAGWRDAPRIASDWSCLSRDRPLDPAVEKLRPAPPSALAKFPLESSTVYQLPVESETMFASCQPPTT